MSVQVYPVGRNYDGTGFSPLYYSSASLTNGQMQWLTPSGRADYLVISTTPATIKAISCTSQTVNVYLVQNLFAVIEETSGRIIITINIHPDVRFYDIYIGPSYTNANALAIYIPVKTVPFYNNTNVYLSSSIDSDSYVIATLSPSTNCTSQTYITGIPLITGGRIYLIAQGKESSFYTAPVPIQSCIFITNNLSYSGLNSDLKGILVEYSNSTDPISFAQSQYGIVPSSTNPILTTPSPTVGSANYISPQTAATIKQKSKTYSLLFMIFLFVFLAIIIIISIIVFLLTIRKRPHTPLYYDANANILTDLQQ